MSPRMQKFLADRGELRPTKRPGAERLWQAIRVMRIASIGELAGVAELPIPRVSSWARLMIKTGFIRANGDVLQLIRNSGPAAPVLDHNKGTVRDPNTNTDYKR